MNVKDLKLALEQFPDDWPVILSTDPEGNSFGELEDVEKSRWNKKEREVSIFELTDELRKKGFSEEDCKQELPPAIVLWP